MDTFENYDGMRCPLEYDRDIINNVDNLRSPVCCEHPNIIFNRRWYEMFYKYDNVYLEGVQFTPRNFACFYRSKLEKYILSTYQISMDNYSNYFVLNGDIRIPLFFCVPCGSCRLCRENKSNEYAFRATCETYTYSDDPLYLTITYKPKYRPKRGVEVTHLQKFFKRLRANLSSMGFPTDFRYLAVGEYGKKKGLPHYHVQLWNYPVKSFKSLYQAYGPIYKSWLSYVYDDDGHRCYVERTLYQYRNGKRRKIKSRFPIMESKGMIKILPVTYGCTGYITKYFRKEQHNKLGYPNKTFLLQSRGNGGIGSEYIRSQYNYVYENRHLDNLEISVFDSHLKKTVSRSVTGYLKNLLFPSRSSILKRKQYDIVKKLCDTWHCLQACVYALDKDFKITKLFNFSRIRDKLTHYLSDYPRYYYQNEYSWIFKACKSSLKQYFRILVDDLVSFYLKIDFSLLDAANRSLSRRDEFMLERSKVQSKLSISYNVVASLDKYNHRYQRYCNKCLF